MSKEKLSKKKKEKMEDMPISLSRDTIDFWNSKEVGVSGALEVMPILFAELLLNSGLRDLENARCGLKLATSVTLAILSNEGWE